jgi:ADP-heptose:LPS heptosyltransferase
MATSGPRVLLCQPRWLGDVLLCTPAAHALRHALPAARIDFLTEPAGAAVLAGNDDLDGIRVLPRSIPGRVRMMAELRRAGYDAVVDFRSTGTTAAMAFASNAPLRIGTRGRGVRNRAYNHVLPREWGPVYIVLQKVRMLAPLGVDSDRADRRLRIAIGDADRRRATAILEDTGIGRGNVVIAVSGASRIPQKRWGASHWARIADVLADAGARIILTHGPGEAGQVAEIARLMRSRPVSEYGTTTVRELAALFQRCALWVGNDGGPKHIAAAAGTPTLAVVRPGGGAVWNDTDDPLQDFVEAAPRACASCAAQCLGHVDEAQVLDLALNRLR